MAEVGIALLTVVFDNIFNKLSSLFRNEFHSIQGGLSEDLDRLRSTLSKFQHVLQDAEVKDFKSAATRDWLRKLRYVANEADGILDDAMDSDSDSDDDNQARICRPFPPFIDFNRVAIRYNLGERIRSVTQKFDLLDSEKLDFGEIDMKRETTSTLSERKVFGRNEANEEIVKALLNGADIQTGGPPFIYAIVGIGGIGKTTLAQLIYKDEKVVENYDPRLWVWISQTFDAKIVMRKLIELHSTPCPLESLETMQNQLKKLLNGKKFFIVLDDIWISNEDLGEWNKFKSVLECGAIGSSVILTTRQSDVASLAGSHNRHNISLLSEKQSWDLFKESSFLEEKQESVELEVIGKQIVQKCQGLPLAVKNLGGSLRSTRVVREWESVRDSEIWELERSCDILPALKLSLNRLESHSRDCFAFSSIFPKGYYMCKEQLIHLWMANDLVPLHRRLDLEDTGNKILNELLLKSFFQVSGNFFVTMHDLMHDLGRSFRGECFSLEGPDVSIVPAHILQMYIPYRDSLTPNILETLSKSHPSLRTCILRNPYLIPNPIIIFKNLDCLRALSLEYCEMNNLHLSIERCKHLKYLMLSKTKLAHLPDIICTLMKLQTLILHECRELTNLPDGIGQLNNLRHLDLSGCKKLTHLPVGISQLTNLRHLDLSRCEKLRHLPVGISQLTNLRHLKIDKCGKLRQMPGGIGKLVYLRTLRQFNVGQESGQRITELQGLNHLEGNLEIRGLQHVRDASEAREAVLKEKKNMSSLSLIWGDSQGSNNTSDEAEGVLEALQPPQSLNGKLVIEGYGGSIFAASWIKRLENLVAVELRDCVKCERLPPLGQLPLLRNLTITGMKSLRCIDADFYGGEGCTGSNSCSERRRIFPSLERLVFENIEMLEEWHAAEVTGRKQTPPCPRLEYMRLSNCPALQSLPLMGSSLVEMYIQSCRSLKSLSQSLRDQSTLESLWVGWCDQLEFSIDDFQNLISLKTLLVSDLPRVASLPNLQYLRVLESLTVSRCEQLELSTGDFLFFFWRNSGDFQHLANLRSLELGGLNKLTSLPEDFQHLRSLKSLHISNCQNLKTLSPGLQNLTSLQRLHLESLNKLTSLPEDFQHLRSLQELEIWDCPNLKTLPPGLQNLTSLQWLRIERCHSDLHLRCKKDKGECWPLISHIKEICINEIETELMKLKLMMAIRPYE